MHRVKVRVVEDALDANNTIARANRDDFDRHGVTVVNLMSARDRVVGVQRVLDDPDLHAVHAGSSSTSIDSTSSSSPAATRTSAPPHVGQRNTGSSIFHSRAQALHSSRAAITSCSSTEPSQTPSRVTICQ